MEFIKIILIILLIYFGLKILLRILAPILLKYASKKMEKKFKEGFGQFQQQTHHSNQANQEKEGEISIDKQPSNKSKSSKKVGEYIDFEEIDE